MIIMIETSFDKHNYHYPHLAISSESFQMISNVKKVVIQYFNEWFNEFEIQEYLHKVVHL